MEPTRRNRVLVRGVNWIGDAVMTTPALRALKRDLQRAALSLLVKPSVSALFAHDPHLDDIVLYGAEFRGVAGKARLAALLRKKAFDTAVLLQNAFDAALVAYLAGIPERIGYDRDGRGFLLTKRIPSHRGDRRMHHIDYYLALLRGAGLHAERASPWLYLTIEERLVARQKLAVLTRPILGVNPGAHYGSAKRWLPERFAEVARLFISETGGSVVIFGGKDDIPLGHEIEQMALQTLGSAPSYPPSLTDVTQRLTDLHSPIVNLAGRTDLRDLMALIAECDLFLTNDSGPMHISYALGTPLVALFGSTEPSLTGPVGEGHEVIRSMLPCSPCFKRTCPEKTLRCMRDITPGDVFAAIRRIVPRKRAVFLDRDGTLCRDAHYLSRWDDFEVFPDIRSLNALRERGFVLIGLTNQSGISRGIVEQRFVEEVNRVFVERYGFDEFLFCPHGPDERCPCRKPETEMVARARGRHHLDTKRSYVIGDKDSDMLLARAVGATGVLVTTEQHASSPHADLVAANLGDAVRSILAREDAA